MWMRVLGLSTASLALISMMVVMSIGVAAVAGAEAAADESRSLCDMREELATTEAAFHRNLTMTDDAAERATLGQMRPVIELSFSAARNGAVLGYTHPGVGRQMEWFTPLYMLVTLGGVAYQLWKRGGQ